MNKNSSLIQPKGLTVCALVAGWQRAGFYLIQAIFILYLTGHLQFNDTHAYALYAAYAGLLYATPVLGGMIADHILGFKQSIYIGILLYLIGYILLLNQHTMYWGFAAQIAGNCFTKSNIPSLLGSQYKPGDVRRESGFTLYYFGINIGQIAGPILAAVTLKHFGYHSAFLVAIFFMLLCLISFMIGKKFLDIQPIITKQHRLLCFDSSSGVYLFILAAIGLIAMLLKHPSIINGSIDIISLLSFLYLIYLTLHVVDKTQRRKMFVIIVLFCLSVLYWALFMQIFTTIILFTTRNVNTTLFSWQIPVSGLISVEAIGIFLIAPLLSKLWLRLGTTHWQPSYCLKFAYSFLFVSMSYALIIFAIHFFAHAAMISVAWVITVFLLLSVSELCLGAIGLAAISNLAPRKYLGVLMGFWHLTIAAGLMLANKLSDLATAAKPEHSTLHVLLIYENAFKDYLYIALLGFIIAWTCATVIKRINC